MSMVNLLWNVGQQLQIEEAKRRAGDAKSDAQLAAQQAIDQTYLPFVKQLDKLGLVCQAM